MLSSAYGIDAGCSETYSVLYEKLRRDSIASGRVTQSLVVVRPPQPRQRPTPSRKCFKREPEGGRNPSTVSIKSMLILDLGLGFIRYHCIAYSL